MRLAFDLDGTLADMHSALAREARDLFPAGIDPQELPRSAAPDEDGDEEAPAASDEQSPVATHALSGRQLRRLWDVVCSRTNFWETLDEIEPGALARLYKLVQERGWELIFLTSRPETAGDTAQMQSYRWLRAQGYEAPSIFVVHGSRGKIAAALHIDVLVDDRPENCLDVAVDSTARAILVWRETEGTVPTSARQLGIGTVSSIGQCLDLLAGLDHKGRERGGLLDALRRLFGLKSRSVSRDVRSHPAEPPAVPLSGSPR